MKYRLVITGSGGFIGSYLTPKLKEEGFDIVTVKYRNGDLIFSDPLETNESVVVVNMAAATKGAGNFTIGYDLSVLMTDKLFEIFKEKNVSVQKFIQFASFGELCYEKTMFGVTFLRKYKDVENVSDNYQFWKIKQREAILSHSPISITNIVIPFVSNKNDYDVSNHFCGMRWGRKILVTRLKDIFDAVKNTVLNGEEMMIIPRCKRVKIKGSALFIKNSIVRLIASVIASDKSKREVLFYTLASQSIKSSKPQSQ